MITFQDEFFSEEDLDLPSLSEEEFQAAWLAWLQQAQITNADDQHRYNHGVFMSLEDDGAAFGRTQ